MRYIRAQQTAVTCLFLGSMWGFLEATLGYFLHILSKITFMPSISGFVMFPIAFFFMRLAFKETDSVVSIFYTAAVAATIKLVDLFIPVLSPVHVVNPAIAIILEGLAVSVFFKVFTVREGRFMFAEGILVSAGWRILFIAFLFVFYRYGGLLARGSAEVSRFILLDGFVNGIIIAALLKAMNSETGTSFVKLARLHLSLSIITFAFAVAVNAVFTLM